jgi:hypothetical protein
MFLTYWDWQYFPKIIVQFDVVLDLEQYFSLFAHSVLSRMMISIVKIDTTLKSVSTLFTQLGIIRVQLYDFKFVFSVFPVDQFKKFKFYVLRILDLSQVPLWIGRK